jgi:transcriptional regulator with GAF, ATPase, and Fis domain
MSRVARVVVRDWGRAPSFGKLRARLADVGVEVASAQSAPVHYTLFFFGSADDEVPHVVYDLSAGGRQRVLAIAASRDVLTNAYTWRLLAAGAADVFHWDGSIDPELQVSARIGRWRAVDDLVNSAEARRALIGESANWRRQLQEIVEAAHFTRAPVLITGESGTGKELVARLIHALDPRPDKGDFVVLDCTTVVQTLSGSEFFGHEKGAFTGAVAARDGAFAMANRGTLFLDEVSELPLPLQAELLRVVQEGMYKRVGSNTWRRTDFRLVAATNRDLLQEQAAGRFRGDLYYRIAGWAFHLPPLRERPGDIPLLARYFISETSRDGPPPDLDPAVEELLVRREYAGNVRDLRQLMARIAARHVGPGPVTVGDIPPEDRPAVDGYATPVDEAAFEGAVRQALARGLTLREITQQAGDTAVRLASDEALGNLQLAAARLGVTDRALQLRKANGRA